MLSSPLRRLLLCFVILSAQQLSAQTYTLSGSVSDAASGEALISATIRLVGQPIGTLSNNYGFYSLSLPAGSYKVAFAYVGYRTDTLVLRLDQNTRYDARLREQSLQAEEVLISASKGRNEEEVKSPQMSQINLKIKDLMMLPSLGGEMDIMKVVQLLPGVTKGGEGTTSILVRGGDPDQNLILLDEATVYNVSHLFGFFSVFNPDALKDLNLVKGGFPAQYGGRLSSVMDISTREGDMYDYHLHGGIGLLSSRLSVEGPIVKERASFIVSGRRSYIDAVFKPFGLTIPYYFYDLNAKVNYKISDKDRIYFSSYLGNDVLYTPRELRSDSADLGLDFGFKLGNFTNTLRWNHLFSSKHFSNLSLINTRFQYDIQGKFANNSIFIGSNVTDFGLKADLSYFPDPDNTIRYGGQVIQHIFRPNIIIAQGEFADLIDQQRPLLLSQEIALYGQHERVFSKHFRLNYGLRLSGAAVSGAFYFRPEPRAAAALILNERFSFKGSYARMAQYMHLVSSSTVALPTDLWYPVTDQIKPQLSDQLAAGMTWNLPGIGCLLTVEGYHKWMNNLTEYREGANLILNDNFESELLQGKGRAWGAELLLKRDEGRLTGWIGYTLSFSQRHFPELNNGKPFWARYDRRHDLSIVASYKISEVLNFSAVYSYLSGARFTPQIGQYIVPNPAYSGLEIIPIYSDRNAIRLTAARRLDVNLVLKSRRERRWKGEWHIGAYNVLNDPTPVRVRIDPIENGVGFRYTQPSFIGFIPSIAYNFQF